MSIPVTLVYYDNIAHERIERTVNLRELRPTLDRPFKNIYKEGWPLDKETLNYYLANGKHYYCQRGYQPIGSGIGMVIE